MWRGGPIMETRTANIRRLWDAEAGLPLLSPQWAARVEAAPPGDLAKLRKEFDRAPIDRAKLAARAGYLLVAMDEPPDGGGPTKLDGERAHWVRVGLVDLSSETILLSMRKRATRAGPRPTARHNTPTDSTAAAAHTTCTRACARYPFGGNSVSIRANRAG